MVEKEKEAESLNEQRIRSITNLYYSNSKVIDNLLRFSSGREVVPRYFEGFGRRPDTLQYPSDILGLVQKGATSFHASEEIWRNPLEISSDMNPIQMNELRTSWDLLIDIDSPFLDYSRAAAILLLDYLESKKITHYGIKFSGSKGFHIIISGKAFPENLEGKQMKDMFPEWPRAICEFLMEEIRPMFNRGVSRLTDFKALERRMNAPKENFTEVTCPQCGRSVKREKLVLLRCSVCGNETKQTKTNLARKRVLRCINERCAGKLEQEKEEDYFYCEHCKMSNISKMAGDEGLNVKQTSFALESDKYTNEMHETISEKIRGGFDLVLVAPRHLFRMPFSLHEKTSLASVVIDRKMLESFSPRDANPLKVEVRDFLPEVKKEEATGLLLRALEWKAAKLNEEEKADVAAPKNYKNFQTEDYKGVEEKHFPAPIKKLLKGLADGKKRGLFILITFLRSVGFSHEQASNRIKEWNKLNDPPLKEGYVRAQIDWHFKQKKQIMPPNYDNPQFYSDIGLIDKKSDVKNPLVDVKRALFKDRRQV